MGHLLPAGVLLYVQCTTICVEFQGLSSGDGVRRNYLQWGKAKLYKHTCVIVPQIMYSDRLQADA